MIQAVRQYIEAAAGFTIFALFLQALIGERMQQSIGFVLGLMLLLIICRPLGGLLHAELDFPAEYKAIESADYETLREEFITNGIKAELEQELVRRTGAERAEVELEADNNIRAVRLYNADPTAAESAALLCGTDNIVIMEE